MSNKKEDYMVDLNESYEDELLLSDDEVPSSKQTVINVNVDRPTSTVTKPPCPSTQITIDDLWAEAIGMEIDPVSAVDKKFPTTTLVASPDQSLLKESLPVKVIFSRSQGHKTTERQNEFANSLKNQSKRDSGDSDDTNGRFNIKLNAERLNGSQTKATKLQFKKKRYRQNRRPGDFTVRESQIAKPIQSQSHFQLKFKPVRPLFTQKYRAVNSQQPMNQLNRIYDGYSYQRPYNMWQDQPSNSIHSFVNRESNSFFNINHKSPIIIQTPCNNDGNIGTRSVLKNPNFEGTKQLVQTDMINEQNLSGRSFKRIDDLSGKNAVLSSGDLRNLLKNRALASTVTKGSSEVTWNKEVFPKNKTNVSVVDASKSILMSKELNALEAEETRKYLFQIEQQKLQREKIFYNKELRRQETNSDFTSIL